MTKRIRTGKIISLILLLALTALCLCSCGEKEAVPSPEPTVSAEPVAEPSAKPSAEPSPEPTVELVPQPDSPEETEEPENVIEFPNPLTGLPMQSGKYLDNRPYAVMINNLKAALPQHGVRQADIILSLIHI